MATNYFFDFPGQEEELELTYNHDGRSYELGTAYGHIAIGRTISTEPFERIAEQGIEPGRSRIRPRGWVETLLRT